MKRRGTFVVEASYLVPFICLLLVYVVFFTLYAHDYAVCAHTALEVGAKGLYWDGRSDRQMEEDVKENAEHKLKERLLWMQQADVEVSVDPVQINIRIRGSGNFLSVDGIKVQRKIRRIQPCEMLRRSKWMRN